MTKAELEKEINEALFIGVINTLLDKKFIDWNDIPTVNTLLRLKVAPRLVEIAEEYKRKVEEDGKF